MKDVYVQEQLVKSRCPTCCKEEELFELRERRSQAVILVACLECYAKQVYRASEIWVREAIKAMVVRD